MEYRDNGERFKNYDDWAVRKNAPYDYARKGLLKHILSNKIVDTKNVITKSILTYYEMSIIFVLKYIDKLKNFKNYHWKNR